ncbi:MAG: glycosyltransferase family 2 protein, partial [Rhodospirillales bacterium]|nr:glycosyltransferase family 2 protein [Rhodospirillales bacterium]
TVARLVEFHRRDPRVKLVELSRNFGKELALTAGLQHTSGAAVVMIDADLQHPPELIRDLVEKWREGWEMVIAVRRSRSTESFLKRINARAFYWLFTRISETKIRPDAGDYRLLDRKVVDVLNRLPEHTRFMKGLYSWVGFKQTVVPYDIAPRLEGHSKFPLLRLWRLALDGLTSFTTVPLQIWTVVGSVAALVGLAYGLFLIAKTLVLGIDVPGYASLMVAVLFFGGLQMITLGIFGEYLGRVFNEVKNRPLYVVRQAYGFDEARSPESVPRQG